jgi:hypothetical protein
MRNKKATGDGDVPGGCTQNVGRQWLQTNNTIDEQYIQKCGEWPKISLNHKMYR